MSQSLKMLLTILLLATPLLAQDELVLTGGDTIKGTITAHDADSVTLQHTALGAIVIPMDKITTIDGRTPELHFKPATTTSEPDPTEPAKDDSKPSSGDSTGEEAPEPAPEEPEWKGSFSLSGSYNTGTAENAALLIRLSIDRDNDHETTKLSTFYRFASADGVTNQSWYNLTANQLWKLPQLDTKWGIFADAQFDWSEQNSWQQRIAGHLGGQYPLLVMKKADDADLWFDSLTVNGRIGIGPRKEFSGANTELVAEGDVGGNLNWEFTDKHSLTANASYLPDLADFDIYRVDAGLNWKIKLDGMDGLALVLGITYQYQSEVAADDENYDLLTTFGVSYDF